MQQIELSADRRTALGRQAKRLRENDVVPAVLYGRDVETVPIQVREKELHRVLARAGGNQLIALRVDGDKKPRMVLAWDVQRDAISHRVLHVDFYVVTMTERIRTEVGLVFTGKSSAVQQGEAMLLQGLDSVEVECLPVDLIHTIEVDLSALKEVDDAILVKELFVSPEITILTDGEELVVKALPVRQYEEEEEEEVEEVEEKVAADEVEVITRGKAAEEEEEETAEEE